MVGGWNEFVLVIGNEICVRGVEEDNGGVFFFLYEFNVYWFFLYL